MDGAIRNWEILAHPVVTIRCFGWRVFLKAALAGRQQTFLSVLEQNQAFQPSRVKVPELVNRCRELELRAKRIYELFAWRFARRPSVVTFFRELAAQEQQHADLLELCRIAGTVGQWQEEYFTQWRDAIPQLEQAMDASEKAAAAVTTLERGLQVLVDIETSPLNVVRDGVVAATGSEFVQRLAAFQRATENHLAFICNAYPELKGKLDGSQG